MFHCCTKVIAATSCEGYIYVFFSRHCQLRKKWILFESVAPSVVLPVVILSLSHLVLEILIAEVLRPQVVLAVSAGPKTTLNDGLISSVMFPISILYIIAPYVRNVLFLKIYLQCFQENYFEHTEQQ